MALAETPNMRDELEVLHRALLKLDAARENSAHAIRVRAFEEVDVEEHTTAVEEVIAASRSIVARLCPSCGERLRQRIAYDDQAGATRIGYMRLCSDCMSLP